MSKRKTTVYIDEDLLRAARVFAARGGKRDSEVIEDALRGHLGIEALERIWSRSDLTEEEALALAYEAVHESRRATAAATPALTERESEILGLIAFGIDRTEIAERLDIPESDIEAAMASAFDKLDRDLHLRVPRQQTGERSSGR